MSTLLNFSNLDQNVEARLNLKPVPAFNNLTMVQIDKVEVTEYEVPLFDEKGSESKSEFKGLKIPRLAITWKNYKLKEDEEDRYHTESWGPIVAIKNDGTPMNISDLVEMYTNMWKQLVHIYNSYKKCPNYVSLNDFPNIDPTAVPETRIIQVKKFFTYFADAFNGKDGKSVFIDEQNLPIASWLKIVTEYKTEKRFVIPTFVGQGFTETVKFVNGIYQKALIEVKPNEKIELKTGNNTKPNNAGIPTESDTSGYSPEVAAILAQHIK
jgi:hypothetical protein